MNNTSENTEPASAKLHYRMERAATATAYSTYRCEGRLGCGERLTTDVLGEHAAKQHHTYDFTKDTNVIPRRQDG